MPELVDDVLELLAPWPSANALAREIGFDSATSAATAAQLAVPLIVAGMVHRLNDPDESAALIEIVRDVDTSGLHDFGSTLTDRAYEPTGTEAVQRILGDLHQSVAIRLAPEAECPEDSAINVFPPMAWAVTGLIAKRNGRDHNRHSLLQIIRNEHDGLLRTGWGEWMAAVAPETAADDHVSLDDSPVDGVLDNDQGYDSADSPIGDGGEEEGVETLDVPVGDAPSRYPPPMPRTSRLVDGVAGQVEDQLVPANEFTATAELQPADLPVFEMGDTSVAAELEDTVHLDEGAHADLAAELRRTVDGGVDDAVDEASDHLMLHAPTVGDQALGDSMVDDPMVVDAMVDDTVVDAELVDDDVDGIDPALDDFALDVADGVVLDGDLSTEAEGEEGLLEHLEQAIAELEAEDTYDPASIRRYEVQPAADVDLEAVVQDAVVPYEREQDEPQSLLPAHRPDVPVVRREESDLSAIESLPPLKPGSELSAYLPPGAGMPDEVVASPRAEPGVGMGFSEFADDRNPSAVRESVQERALGSTGPTWIAVAIGLLLIVVAMAWFLAEDRIASTVEEGTTTTGASDTNSFDLVLDGDGGASAQTVLTFDAGAEEFCYDVSSTALGPAPAVEFGQGQVGAGTPIASVNLSAAADSGCVPMSADVITSTLADPAGHYVTVAGADVTVGSQLGQ